ncbi:EamA family transporter [Rhabdobacter roseus]|uniref:Transporter family protein n=1 Tax=Rhabdobacter roseus TaxID=1655419 RepID=A0A840TJL6_9BACT|nr:EamA family transporter [Rhabdobacter roseus]MBB5283611.1 transporter family protein [Rhabdobacter roseus]
MWIVFALLAAVSAGAAVVLSKAGVKNMNSTLAFALQSILILLISWTAVLWQKEASQIASIDKKTWFFLLGAGVATTLSSLFSFRALKLGDASLVSSLERLSLVFAVAFAIFFLKERLNWQVIVGILLMIGGALLIGFSRQSTN